MYSTDAITAHTQQTYTQKWAVPRKLAYSLAHCGTAHSGRNL